MILIPWWCQKWEGECPEWTGCIIDTAKKDLLKVEETAEPTNQNIENTTEERAGDLWARIETMKEDLITSDEIDNVLPENASEDNEPQEEEVIWIFDKIKNIFGKYTGKNLLPDFKNGLNDMVEAWILTQQEKSLILKELEDPEVNQSIKTRGIGQLTSISYTCMNSWILTPTTTVLFGPQSGAAVFLFFYIIKRLLMSGVIRGVGRKLKNRNYISKLSMVPIIWAHATLVDMYDKHPTVSKYFYAFEKTGKSHQKFTHASDEESKKLRWEEWKEKVDEKAEWMARWSTRWVTLNNWIANPFWGNKKEKRNDIKDQPE